jgi:peptide chain release factor subunit 1
MVPETHEVALPKALELLQVLPPAVSVLSAYVATTPARVRGQDYVFAYRSACANVRSTLPEAEIDAFDASAARVERYLTDGFVPGEPGVAVFAAPDPHDYFFVVRLPATPTEQVAWDTRPHVEPLVAILDDYERVAVALFDKERARLFTVNLGEIEERLVLEDEVPGRQATGGWFALAQTRYARHHEEHVRRHVKRTIDALTKLVGERPCERLLLAGPDEALTMLKHHLPRALRARLAGTLDLELFAGEADIVRAVNVAAQALERQDEIIAVNELVDAVTSRYVVLGVEDTVAALNDGRVFALLIADAFVATGRECRACGRLVTGNGPCPQCGTLVTGDAGYREALVRHALAQGAKIEEVSGEATERLSEYDGIGAWTRY